MGVSGAGGFERWVVLLAGGIGSRFWPASTPQRPKQFLPLVSDEPLIVETLERARQLTRDSQILIVSGEVFRPLFERLGDLEAGNLLLEPEGKGTAAALAWAARAILDRSSRPERCVMVSLHSDHLIWPADRFLSTLDRAIDAAGRLGRLLTIGVRPTRPATGYGYIEVGTALESGVFEVRRFVEKPDRATAARYLERGDFLWNSGIFVWRPDILLSELQRHTPELAAQLEHLARGDLATFYDGVPSLSIDHGLLERSSNIAVVEAEFEWDDVGAWDALARARTADARGNVSVGDAHLVDAQRTIVWAEEGPVVAFGTEDLIIARASGITFVAPVDRAGALKDLLARLPASLRTGTHDDSQ